MAAPYAPFDASAIRAILLDIEGTTTPVAFVYDVLFPFARTHVRRFLEAHAAEAAVRADLEALRREHATDSQKSPAPSPWPDSPTQLVDAAVAYVHWLMDRDRKSTPLKSLQGKIWEAGYRSGELRGQVYPDVPPALARWKQQGRKIAIFSSGSVQAQKLLFGHSTAGDLTRFLDAYFDTTTGPKQEPQSYRKIAAALGLNSSAILFLSDVAAELDAARTAGLLTALCVRPGAKEQVQATHSPIQNFNEVP